VPARRFDLSGRVVKVEGRQVTVAHDVIDGYMDAMVMPFVLKEEWPYRVLEPGDALTAVLVVEGERSWLEEVVITKRPIPTEAAVAPSPTGPAPGDKVPDHLALVDEHGRPLRFDAFRGQALLLTFIYTRCPLPEFCPWVVNRFAEVERALRGRPELYGRTRLLSVSFDHEHDTPAVLRQYADLHRDAAAAGRWLFATGSEEQIRQVTGFFGLEYRAEAREIVHALRTVLIGPDGAVVRVWPGNGWRASEVVAEIERLTTAVH
jgi:protein SCO1/2